MGIDVFNLKAKISLDTKEYEKGLSESKSLFSSFGDGLKSAAGAVGNVLADVAKGATVAIGAAGTALTALTKQSLDIFANFEQLEGGTKLMFGDAADYIIQKSEEAYKTVQLSQNEYLQQVNGFAVGLKTALGGNEQAAAELANKIVQAEADIVAATGNTQEMVQNAFNGIMRSNYTMLDNLGLGIKPTKEGMEEVIQKVNEWNAAHGEATSYVIDNLADVQAALVDYVEMQGMAGYASMEAGSTITGSIAGVKAAWQNFLSGNGNVKDFTDMLIPTVKNIREKLDTIIPRLTEGLTELVDQVSPYIPELIEETLPSIISGASSLLTGLAERLPSLITTILPALADGVLNVSVALVGALPQLIESLKESIPIVVKTIMSKKDDLLKTGKDIISSVFPSDPQTLEGIGSKATEVVGKFLTALTNPENGKKIIDKGFEIIKSFAQGLTSTESLSNFFNDEYGAPKIIENLGENLVRFSTNLIDTAVDIIANVCGYLLNPENKEEIRNASEKILITLGEGFCDLVHVTYKDITDAMAQIATEMVNDFDADDTAGKLMLKLGKAIGNYVLYDSLFGWVIGTAEGKYIMDLGQQMDEDQAYNDSNFMGSREAWDAMSPEEQAMHMPNTSMVDDSAVLTAKGMRASGHIPANMGEEYLMRYSGRSYDAPMYSEVPTIANTSYGDNVTNITINAPSGNAEDISNSLVSVLDEKIATFQAQNNRGFGYVGGR